MNGQDQENLKGLFEEFFSCEQAASTLDDLQRVAKMLCENPAPQPDSQLIADIKWQIQEAVASRRRVVTFRSFAYRVAVAAAIIIIAAIGTRFLEKGREEPGKIAYASIIPRAVWDSDDITAADADLVILTTEIQQIEDEVLTLQLGPNKSNGENLIVELETEFIKIGSDFWKG